MLTVWWHNSDGIPFHPLSFFVYICVQHSLLLLLLLCVCVYFDAVIQAADGLRSRSQGNMNRYAMPNLLIRPRRADGWFIVTGRPHWKLLPSYILFLAPPCHWPRQRRTCTWGSPLSTVSSGWKKKKRRLSCFYSQVSRRTLWNVVVIEWEHAFVQSPQIAYPVTVALMFFLVVLQRWGS